MKSPTQIAFDAIILAQYNYRQHYTTTHSYRNKQGIQTGTPKDSCVECDKLYNLYKIAKANYEKKISELIDGR